MTKVVAGASRGSNSSGVYNLSSGIVKINYSVIKGTICTTSSGA